MLLYFTVFICCYFSDYILTYKTYDTIFKHDTLLPNFWESIVRLWDRDTFQISMSLTTTIFPLLTSQLFEAQRSKNPLILPIK